MSNSQSQIGTKTISIQLSIIIIVILLRYLMYHSVMCSIMCRTGLDGYHTIIAFSCTDLVTIQSLWEPIVGSFLILGVT